MTKEAGNNGISSGPPPEKLKYFWIIVVVSWLFLSGGFFLMMKKMIVSEPESALMPPKAETARLEPAKEEKLRKILNLYFEAYKNAGKKKNYEELKGFLAQDAAESFSGEWLTNIDDYLIEEIARPDFLIGDEEAYQARVKIFKNGLPINPPTGETWPVFIAKKGDEFKIKTWIFVLPGLTPSQ